MTNKIDRTIYSIPEAAEWLDIDQRLLLEKLISEELNAYVRSPYDETDDWFCLGPLAIKKSFELGVDTVEMKTVEGDGGTGDWEKTLSWEQVFIFRDDLHAFSKNVSRNEKVGVDDRGRHNEKKRAFIAAHIKKLLNKPKPEWQKKNGNIHQEKVVEHLINTKDTWLQDYADGHGFGEENLKRVLRDVLQEKAEANQT